MGETTGCGREGAADGAKAADVAMRAWSLFVSTFTVSMTANTGYAILAAMRHDVCERHGWLGEDEMADCIALAQSAPGPIAVNASVAVGWRVAGMVGALSAVVGCILPPFLSMLAVSLAYGGIAGNALVVAFLRGMRLGVVVLLVDVLVGLIPRLRRQGGVWSLALVAASFLYVRYVGASVAWLALACALVGAGRVLFERHLGEDGRG